MRLHQFRRLSLTDQTKIHRDCLAKSWLFIYDSYEKKAIVIDNNKKVWFLQIIDDTAWIVKNKDKLCLHISIEGIKSLVLDNVEHAYYIIDTKVEDEESAEEVQDDFINDEQLISINQ